MEFKNQVTEMHMASSLVKLHITDLSSLSPPTMKTIPRAGCSLRS